MVIDNYVPKLNDLLIAYNNRIFPARFGRDTSNERALMALPKGKDPGIQNSGYKIAHIVNVGKDYLMNSRMLSLSKILDEYFPRGERSDWVLTTDKIGECYIRQHNVAPEAKKLLIAEFLRFVHPFNYFLSPKKNCAISTVCKDISEYKPLTDYVQRKYSEIYGDAYKEYLSLIMIDKNNLCFTLNNGFIGLQYGLDITENKVIIKQNEKTNESIQEKAVAAQPKDLTIRKPKQQSSCPKEVEMAMIEEYLTNSKTSFRKLEREFLGIDSQARGGGFVAKKIINSHGISAKQKGIYSKDETCKLLPIKTSR